MYEYNNSTAWMEKFPSDSISEHVIFKIFPVGNYTSDPLKGLSNNMLCITLHDQIMSQANQPLLCNSTHGPTIAYVMWLR